MKSNLQHFHHFDISYSVSESKNSNLVETIILKIYALEKNNEILTQLDILPLITDLTPYIEFNFQRIILEDDSSESLLDIADSYSAQLYNMIKPLVNPRTKDFVQDIFNIQNAFEITHFIYLEKAIIHSNFPKDSLFAAISKGFSSLFKGIPSHQVAGGLFKLNTFYNEHQHEIDRALINQIIIQLNIFELSAFISQISKKNNIACIFSGTFFNKTTQYIPMNDQIPTISN